MVFQNISENDVEFYLSIKNKKNYIIYESEPYKLSEIDLINLIKICLIEARSKAIGRKLMMIYRDSTAQRKKITEERLKKIGVEDERKPEFTTSKKPRIK